MAKVDFSDILNQQVGSAPEPKPLPEGTYYGTIAGIPTTRLAKTKEGEKPLIVVKVALTEAGEDVDSDALAEAGGLMRGDGEPKIIQKEFWLDESSRYQYDRLFSGFGIEGVSYADGNQQLPGRDAMVFVKQRTYEAGGETRTVNDVARIAARE